MADDLAIGTGITLACILVSGLGFWLAEAFFTRHHDWLRQPPHGPRLFAVAAVTTSLVLAVTGVSVLVWALAFHLLGLFDGFEVALYFALASFTTLGYGDVIAPDEWRILGALAGVHGFLDLGLLTTLLIDGLGHVREGYREARTAGGEVSADPRSAPTARPPAPPPSTAG